MGSGRTDPTKPDLFSTTSVGDPASPSVNSPPSSTANNDGSSSPRHVLPRDLPSAIKQLNDQELDQILAAALAERKRRGGKSRLADQRSHTLRIKEAAPPLAVGKLNAVRAAFAAGVTPSRIARQFGISQSQVHKALALVEKTR